MGNASFGLLLLIFLIFLLLVDILLLRPPDV
jgi:hypothetical protein